MHFISMSIVSEDSLGPPQHLFQSSFTSNVNTFDWIEIRSFENMAIIGDFGANKRKYRKYGK